MHPSPPSRPFGITQRPVVPIGQGSWRTDEAHDRTAIDALRRGLDLGLTHIDTAELYGAGKSETLIGRAIEGRRDEVFLVSKVMPGNASLHGTVEACERSLSRLQTDRLDCYLLHWRGSHPLADTVAAFERLVRDGKIRSWGVSNFDVDDLEEVLALNGVRGPACNQVLYHVGERAIEHAVLPWCRQHGTAVVAYTPFGEAKAPYDPDTRQGRVLHRIAASHGATARQVALAFLLRDPAVFVIPKAARISHVEDNARAMALTLTDSDLAEIDAAFPRGRRPRSLPMI